MVRSREQMPSPDEQAEIEKERAISDAELLKDGAEYEIKDGKKTLSPTEEQVGEAKEEMQIDFAEKRYEKRMKEFEKVVDRFKRYYGGADRVESLFFGQEEPEKLITQDNWNGVDIEDTIALIKLLRAKRVEIEEEKNALCRKFDRLRGREISEEAVEI